MHRLQGWILLLSIWLITLVVVEQTLVPTVIPFDVLIFIIITIGLGLFFAELESSAYTFVLSGVVIAFAAVKLLRYGIPHQGPALHVLVTQSGALVLTGLIAQRIGSHLHAFAEVISGVTFSNAAPLPATFADAQTMMYRELQRARHYERPLSIVMLQVDEEAMQAAIPRISVEVQQTMMARYILSKVARILDEDLPKFDPVALRDNCFIAVLPEATATDAGEIVQRLRSTIEEQTGLKMRSGTATLLSEAMTFEELIECAEAKLHQKPIYKNGRHTPDLDLDQSSLLSETKGSVL